MTRTDAITRTPSASGTERSGRSSVTIRLRLRAFVAIGVVLVAAVAYAAWYSVDYMRDRTEQIHELTDRKDRLYEFELASAAVRNTVMEAVFAGQGNIDLPEAEAIQAFQAHVGAVTESLSGAQAGDPPADTFVQIRAMTESLSNYLTEANRITALAYSDVDAAAAALPAFEALADLVTGQQQEILLTLDSLVLDAQARGDRVPGELASVAVALVAIAIALLGASAFVIGRSLRRSLGTLGEVARAIAGGDLRARTAVNTDDELGELASAINEMASDLEVTVRQMEVTAERDGFGSRLSEALEMADTESEAMTTIERAMLAVSSTAPMEILLADSSKSHLARSASNPIAGAPGCPVESPFSCVAVRRGNPVVFDDSEALNACPKLRDRAAGSVAAVCVPVTFMGRALGVLHSTAPVGAPLPPKAVGQLTALATQAGARIGTVRSFERTQLQATTDGLTGLRNRRTAETELRGLLNDGVQLSLVMADLDHFKLLNDTYGHATGDRALRVFSQVLESSLRESDIAARFGGEEFVIAMPNTTVATAADVLDRLQERLAGATAESGNPSFTASFGVVDSSVSGSLEELLRVADAALYRAKEDGRNRTYLADQRDVVEARQPATPPTTVAAGFRRLSTVGALQRAAALDDPMPEGALQR